MPRMPEIIGDVAETEPEPTVEMAVQFRESTHPGHPEAEDYSTNPGFFLSPLRLRLEDFSGQGERAPPE